MRSQMTEQQRPPQTSEQSLKYIAWSLKDLAKSMEEINHSLESIKTILDTYLPNIGAI